MPSPSRRASPHRPAPNPTPKSPLIRASRRNTGIENNGNDAGGSNELRQQETIGKRTGVTLPPRGEIPIEDGFESVDAFWNSAKSPATSTRGIRGSAGRLPSPSTKSKAKLSEREQEHEKQEEENRRKREEIEKELAKNLEQGPSLLENGASQQEGFQQTPKQPPQWNSRALHKAMGIPTEDSPAYTVLSRVSTAPASAATSISTSASNVSKTSAYVRHSMRQDQDQAQLNSVADETLNIGGVQSPEASDMAISKSAEEESVSGYEKRMDPPEERNGGVGSRGGIGMALPDPEEKDFVLEPPEERDGVDDDNGSNIDRGVDDEEEGEADFPPQRELMSATLSSIAEESSQQSQTQQSEGSREDVEVGMDNTSNKTTPSRALDETMEDVVDTFDNEYNNDDDDGQEDNEYGDGFQLATQEDPLEEDINFNAGGGHDNELDAISHQSSKRSSNGEEGNVSVRNAEEEGEVEEIHNKKTSKKLTKHDAGPSTPSVLRKKGSKKKNPSQHVAFSTPTGRANGYPAGNREYEAVPVSDYKDEYPQGQEPRTPGGTELRRSKRAKFKPLQFWKNEKLIYEAHNEGGILGEAMGDMPVVTGVQHALPTPYKERKVRETKPKQSKKRQRNDSGDDHSDEEPSNRSPFDDQKLRKRFNVRNGEHGAVWSESMENTMETKLISRLENRTFSKLPLSTSRKKSESKVVGFASQAFHVLTDEDDLFPGYIAGNVVLPPRGIKDAEGVGLCSQVFNVGDCQPNSLEFAIADPSGQDGEFDPKTAQRYLLSKGDMFQIPPGNVYRIENHSKTDKASLFWTIIKCTSRAEQGSDEEE